MWSQWAVASFVKNIHLYFCKKNYHYSCQKYFRVVVSQFKKINRQILMHAVKNFNYILNVNSLLMKDAKECVG